MNIRGLSSPIRSYSPHPVFEGQDSDSGRALQTRRGKTYNKIFSSFKRGKKKSDSVKVDREDVNKFKELFLLKLGYVLEENKAFLDQSRKPISDSVKRIIKTTSNFFERNRHPEEDFDLEDIHRILRENREEADLLSEGFYAMAWRHLSKAVAFCEEKGIKHPDEFPKLFNLVMPHEIRQHIWDNLSSERKEEIESSYKEWKDKLNPLNPSLFSFIPQSDKTIALFYFSRCYLSPESHQRLEEEIFSQLDKGIHFYPKDDNSGKFYLPEQLADELSNENSSFRTGFIAYFKKILECEPDQTRVQDLLSPDHLKMGLETLAQWIRDNKTLFQSGENDYAFALRSYFMKLRFDRMYKAVEGDAPLKRLLLLFCFQGFLLKHYPFDFIKKDSSGDIIVSIIPKSFNKEDRHWYKNLCHYDHNITLRMCLNEIFYFSAEEYHQDDQPYEGSNSILYAVPFMYYLKEYFQPSKDREVLSQLLRDAVLVGS